jgi:phosphatidate cytidylyltransferase
MLRWRIVLGILFVGALVGLCYLDSVSARPGMWLSPLVALLALAGARELLDMFALRGLHPWRGGIYLGNLAIVASSLLPLTFPDAVPSSLNPSLWPLLVTALSLGVLFFGEMRRYEGPGTVTIHLGLGTFCLAYVGLLLVVLAQLRFLGGPKSGLFGLLVMIAVVKMGDIGAYTVGRLIGRHKMAPKISPGKTWEGAAGALAFSALAAWLLLAVIGPAYFSNVPLPPADMWPLYGLLLAVAGMTGDLAESLVKRDLGCKDSSQWMPGFGGVLDILDSILLAGPVAYLAWQFGLAWVGASANGLSIGNP